MHIAVEGTELRPLPSVGHAYLPSDLIELEILGALREEIDRRG